jgi:DNA-directed RNA polymerase specialized sigma subunit
METMSVFKVSLGPWPELRYNPETAAVMLREYSKEGFLDAREGDPAVEVEAADLRNKVNNIISRLRPAEKTVINCVYGDYDLTAYESPYAAAAAAAEISPERAQAIHKQLLVKLRRYLSCNPI